MKIHRFFTTVIYIYTFKVSKTYNRIVHEYECLFLAFILLQIERESGKQNLGVKEKCPNVTYLIFLTGFHWRIFLLSRANRLVLFLVLAWRIFGVLRVSVSLLSLARSKMAIVRLPRDLLKKLPYYPWGEGNPTSVWGPRQSFGFFFLFPFDVRQPKVT